ncbi:MAG: hypothetical protein V4537_03245 [Pseudomonadota bacterium]
MDSATAIDDRGESARPDSAEHEHADGAVSDVRVDVGGDERRMHVRAYNHWVSLLQGRAYPSIEDLDPASISDFGPHSVLLDFTQGIEDPRIAFLGRTLRDECGIEAGITQISEVPSRSLLSRLTDHYLQIIANRAPIGFEAEFVGTRGFNTMYRGILMPFSSDEGTIDYIYGVINWKELVDAATQAQLNADLAAARRTAAPATAAAPVWADGPSAAFASAPEEAGAPALPDGASLDERLSAARASAAAFAASEGRSRSALYAAIGHAHGIATAAVAAPQEYADLLAIAGLSAQARAPMTPVVKLVFGSDYDKTRLTEFASVLTHAQRHEIGRDGLPAYLESFPGGIKGVVGAERALRRKPAQPDLFERIAAELRERPALGHVDIPRTSDGEFVVLLARADASGGLDVVACLDGDTALTQRTVRRAAA